MPRTGGLLLISGDGRRGKDAPSSTSCRRESAGLRVFSFKTPSVEELDHDILWRTSRCLPRRGQIGIFNRSYYEEVLVVRVHPELLQKERIPTELITRKSGTPLRRHRRLRALPHAQRDCGAQVFLHISKQEQRERFLQRLRSRKRLEVFRADVLERQRWTIPACYEDMIRHTAARMHLVRGSRRPNGSTRCGFLVVVDALKEMKLAYPTWMPRRANSCKRRRERCKRKQAAKAEPSRPAPPAPKKLWTG